ncbi:MAG: hypothetical protein EPN70_02005 [Paraburkholderia sp.]|uniref:hypothetical protein n=1 Tax=Paraburkholderia sp. TaxID=1926495 RepID=UPI001216EE79|nr:hypothetical protein [Paraburkholderia sp.]TAM07683.1 MAG: hypothetical protein EPN70_02005 [Paraburkholderia sp.]
MLKLQPTKGIFLLVTLLGFGVNAFAQQSTADHEPAVAAGNTQSQQVAATQVAPDDHAAIVTAPSTTAPASRKAAECVGPVSFCNIYFGS